MYWKVKKFEKSCISDRLSVSADISDPFSVIGISAKFHIGGSLDVCVLACTNVRCRVVRSVCAVCVCMGRGGGMSCLVFMILIYFLESVPLPLSHNCPIATVLFCNCHSTMASSRNRKRTSTWPSQVKKMSSLLFLLPPSLFQSQQLSKRQPSPPRRQG